MKHTTALQSTPQDPSEDETPNRLDVLSDQYGVTLPKFSRSFASEEAPVSNSVSQSLTDKEREQNLTAIRNLHKVEIEDAKRYSNYEGFVKGRRKLKQRKASDPWFAINDALRRAVTMGDDAEADRLQKLVEQVGGPPNGIVLASGKPYATFDEVFDIPESPERIEMQIKRERAKKNRAVWEQSMKRREESEKRMEEEWGDPYESPEMQKKKERSMRFLYAKLEERRKKEAEKLKKMSAEVKAQGYGTSSSGSTEVEGDTPLDRALAAAKRAAKEAKAKREGKAIDASVSSSSTDTSEMDSETKEAASTNPNRIPGDEDIAKGEIGSEVVVEEFSEMSTNGLRVKVSSSYNPAQSDAAMRKHCFSYTVTITNESDTDIIQLVSRRFEIQTIGSKTKDIVQGAGVTGKTPILKPGETFEYTSTAPLNVRPIGTTSIAARMNGSYSFVILGRDEKPISETPISAQLGTFHFIFPEDQRVKPVEDSSASVESSKEVTKTATPAAATSSSTDMSPTLPGDEDIKNGVVPEFKDSSDTVTEGVRVTVTSEYRDERSNLQQNKLCFAYNVRITNESVGNTVQLVSRRFEIQTVGSANKDVVQGPGVTGRQPLLKPGESFEYTSTAPLNVKMMDSTPVAARMSGDYAFVILNEDGSPLSSTPLKAELAPFHFVIPSDKKL